MSADELTRAALKALANEAARAVTEPRRFYENEDGRQQALGHAVAEARRIAALSQPPDAEEELRETLAAALQELEFNCWPGGAANDCDHQQDAARLLKWLADHGIALAIKPEKQ